MGGPGLRPLASNHCYVEISSLAEGTFIPPDEIFCTVFICVNDYLTWFAKCLPHRLLGGAGSNFGDVVPECSCCKKVSEHLD